MLSVERRARMRGDVERAHLFAASGSNAFNRSPERTRLLAVESDAVTPFHLGEGPVFANDFGF